MAKEFKEFGRRKKKVCLMCTGKDINYKDVDTLRKYKASLVIHEYGKPSKDNFTKLIKVIFDNQNEYKISSYRKEDIQKQDIEKRVSF